MNQKIVEKIKSNFLRLKKILQMTEKQPITLAKEHSDTFKNARQKVLEMLKKV